MKSSLKKLVLRFKFIRKIAREVVLFLPRLKFLPYYFKSVNPKVIFFSGYDSKNFSDSPKALFLELLKNKEYEGFDFYWSFDLSCLEDFLYLETMYPNTYVIPAKGKIFMQVISSAKYIFTATRVPLYVKFKENQNYVMCWHGTPLKKLGFDIETTNNKVISTSEFRRINDLDAKRYSYFLSPSPYGTLKFTSSFNLNAYHKDNIIIEEGYPRNDFLSNYTDKDVENIKERLNIDPLKKVILYAPTWRDGNYSNGETNHLMGLDLHKLSASLGENYVILSRMHIIVTNNDLLLNNNPLIIDVSKESDINNLYVISDLLITDYSSVFFDYSILNRPMIFYMYDRSDYEENARGFYFDVDQVLPGPIIYKEEGLLSSIEESIQGVSDEYINKYTEFKNTFVPKDDGYASKRVLEKIVKN